MEYIYYVDEYDNPTGEIEEKYAAHHSATKLHAAFSCYVFNTKGQMLITRRADTKKVWPGVWTNSFCGHPQPNESRLDALSRRASFELGISVHSIEMVVPDYIYTTPAFNGIIEHEYCPIYFVLTDAKPDPNPDEVSEYFWHDIGSMADVTMLLNENRDWSWWFKNQVETIRNNTSYERTANTYINSCALGDTQPNQSKN